MSGYMPAFWRWDVWVGNNTPIILTRKRDGVPIDITGRAYRLRVRWPGGGIDMVEGDAGFTKLPQSGATLGMIKIQLSLAQTRMLPTAVPAVYEIEQVLAGEEMVILQGEIVAQGGVNADG